MNPRSTLALGLEAAALDFGLDTPLARALCNAARGRALAGLLTIRGLPRDGGLRERMRGDIAAATVMEVPLRRGDKADAVAELPAALVLSEDPACFGVPMSGLLAVGCCFILSNTAGTVSGFPAAMSPRLEPGSRLGVRLPAEFASDRSLVRLCIPSLVDVEDT